MGVKFSAVLVLLLAVFLLISLSSISALQAPRWFADGGGGWGGENCDNSPNACSLCGDTWLKTGVSDGTGSFDDFFDWSNPLIAFISPNPGNPTGIATSFNGDVFFISHSNHVLYKCESDLTNCAVVFGVYGSSGSDNSHLSFAEGLTIDKKSNNIFVADTANNRVLKIQNKTGAFNVLNSITVTLPKDIATDSKGNVFVIDGSSVLKFDEALNNQLAVFDLTILPEYDINNRFNGIDVGSDIYVFGSDSVLIAGYGANKVYQLNNDLNFIMREFGDGTPSESGLYNPTDIAFDWVGNKYVVEYSGARVSKLDSLMNSKIKTLGQFNQCSGFCNPFKIAVNENGLYFTDRLNGKVLFIKRQESCCGNNIKEFPSTFVSTIGACNNVASCNQTGETVCCDTGSGACVFNSQCYDRFEVENIDNGFIGSSFLGEEHFAACDFGWRDGDFSKSACTQIGKTLPISNCFGEDCWIQEGESSNFGEFGDSFGGEGEGSGIFDSSGIYNVAIDSITECCGDDSGEFFNRNFNNPTDSACCNNPNDIVVNGQCFSPTVSENETVCGEVFGECSNVGEKTFCGNVAGEELIFFDIFDGSCNLVGGCSDLNVGVDSACCDTATDCSFNGQCYATGNVVDLDGSVFGSSFAFCNSGKWNDADVSYDVCAVSDFQFDFPDCVGTDCWTSEGEIVPFGEFGDNFGGEFNPTSPPQNASGIYDFDPLFNVRDDDLQECCGDDPGEFYKENGGESACCNSQFDTVVDGECVPQNTAIRDEFFLKRCVNEQDLTFCGKVSTENKKNISYLQYALLHDNEPICDLIINNASLQSYCHQKVQLFQTPGALIDNVAPIVSIDSPTGGVSCHPYNLFGTATDNFGPTSVQYFVDWGSILNDQQGFIDYGNFSKELQLSPSGNTIKVTITDDAGNYTNYSKTVFCPNILTLVDSWSGFASSVSGVAVDNQGFVYISEKNNFRILKLDPNNGSLVSTINLVGQKSEDNGILLKPKGIDVDDAGSIYVAFEFFDPYFVEDSLGGIYKLDSSGNFLQQLGSYYDTSASYVRDPSDVDVITRTDGSKLFVVAVDDDASGGNKLLKFYGNSQFYSLPKTEMTGGSFFVTGDTSNNDNDFFFYSSIWSQGTGKVFYDGWKNPSGQRGPGEFGDFYLNIAGIAADQPNNLLIVSDSWPIAPFNRIYFFDSATQQYLAKQTITATGLNNGLAVFGDFLYFVEQPTGIVYKYLIDRSALQ